MLLMIYIQGLGSTEIGREATYGSVGLLKLIHDFTLHRAGNLERYVKWWLIPTSLNNEGSL